jgi:hypothetical protein
MNIIESNKEIINIIKLNKTFIIARFGLGPETTLCYNYFVNKKINNNNLNNLLRICGIYSKNNDITVFEKYFKELNNAIENSNILACFYNSNIESIQNVYSEMYNLTKIHSRSLEPFYVIQDNEIPWTHYLFGKKVLIVNPFTDSMKKQLDNNFQIFKDKKIFLDNQEFIFYKSFQTHGNHYIHNDWLETFRIMCNDIEKLEFDIALLGCGGYGLPLCNFIKTKMNKSAIYIGGGLQLLFGVMGHRWINREDWKKIIKENNTKFVFPSENEKLDNTNTIESSAYW